MLLRYIVPSRSTAAIRQEQLSTLYRLHLRQIEATRFALVKFLSPSLDWKITGPNCAVQTEFSPPLDFPLLNK